MNAKYLQNHPKSTRFFWRLKVNMIAFLCVCLTKLSIGKFPESITAVDTHFTLRQNVIFDEKLLIKHGSGKNYHKQFQVEFYPIYFRSETFHFWSKMQFCRNVYILDTKLICTAFSSPNINCDGWIWSRIIRSILQSWLQFRSHVSSRSLTGKAITGHYRMEARKRKDTQSKFNFRTKVYTDSLSV